MKNNLQVEAIRALRDYQAATPLGHICIIPRALGYGEEGIVWEARLYKKGLMGPLKVTELALEAIGAPPEWLVRSQEMVRLLTEAYPMPTPAIIAEAEKIAALPEAEKREAATREL
ncbi:unnamed protein product [marine sediment metagenome]|uniref:Uncharacterized protein n=1 Tax=marine sediment metagenome TaxID=412755 RepID=X1S1N1_9ZZZZ